MYKVIKIVPPLPAAVNASMNATLDWRNGLSKAQFNQEGAPSRLQIKISSCGATSLPALLNNPATIKTPLYIKKIQLFFTP